MKLPYPYKKLQSSFRENKIDIKMSRNQGYIHSSNSINRNRNVNKTNHLLQAIRYSNPWGLGTTYNPHFLATEHQQDQTSFYIHRQHGGGCKIFYLLRHSSGLCPQT